MKKNKALRAASALMVLTLLTTSIIGGTFAKYTTSDSASDTARVAKWGVTVAAASNAFATEYATDDADVKNSTTGAIAKSVVTATGEGTDGKNLVAPGTSGKLLNSTITGKPEVAVKVKTEAVLTLDGWTVEGTDYCPIEITIDGTSYKMGTATNEDNHIYKTIKEFKAAVEGALNEEVNVAPNDDLGTTYNHDITWAWIFEGETSDGAYRTDAKDTALGNLTTAPTIEFTYTATVTQID